MPTSQIAKGGKQIEKLNIEGKRSGNGFIAHKDMLVSALERAQADRIVIINTSLGCKGFLGYLKALGGSNIVKVIPFNGDASESQIDGSGLKVICGTNTAYLDEGAFIGEKTPISFCQLRVSPKNSVIPNLSGLELAEAIARVLPFTAKEDTRPVLQCVYFVVKEGKLTLVSSDGFTLAVATLDFEEGEGQALISREELKGIASALKKARRVRLGFEEKADAEGGLLGKSLIIDTELIRYKWSSMDANYPDYEKLIPTEHNCQVHFDTVEAIKAVNSLKALTDAKGSPIDLTIGEGKIAMANADDKGQAEVIADAEGEGKIRIDGNYLAEVLRACGGIAELTITNASSPMLFSHNGYQVVVMPMLTSESVKATEAEAVDEVVAEVEAEAEADTEAEAVADKPKRSRKARKAEAVAEPVGELEAEPTEAELTKIEAEPEAKLVAVA